MPVASRRPYALALLALLASACFLVEDGRRPVAPASGAVPSADISGHGRQTLCTPGESCLDHCPEGACSLICQSSSSCNQTCSGGNCSQTCEVGAACTFSCSGGYCRQQCADISCRTSCSGGGCILEQGMRREPGPAEAPPPGEVPPSAELPKPD